VKAVMKELRNDPARMSEINRDLEDDIAAFHNKAKQKPSN